MEDPNFPVTITVGGNGQTYKFAAFPNQIHANQSFELVATLQKTDLSAYDLTSATATLYVSGWKNEIGATMLASGVIVSNVITFTVAKDLIPESLGTLPLRNPGNSVFYFIVEDTDSTLQFFQQVNVLDTDYTLDGTVESSPSTITPDKNDLGTVTQVNLNTPPGSPSFQDAYIIGTSPTGDWASNANDLAVYNGSSWVFYDTVEGNFVFDSNTSQQQLFNGTTWNPTASITYSDGDSLNDNNSNELLTFGVTASAVNNVKITNQATGSAPKLEVIGDDTNIDLDIAAKGTGKISLGNLPFDADQTVGASQDDYVLTYDDGTGLISLEASTGGAGTFNNQTGTSYTLVLADGDGNTTVTMNNASANTVTIPTNASVGISTDIAIAVMQYGAGSTTVAGDTGVTVNGVSGGSVEINNQYSGLVLTKTATDTWIATVGSSGAGTFLPTTDSADLTSAHTVVAGDINETHPIGSATSADFDITFDVSLLSSTSDQIGFKNESDYIARIVVSNTSTMTLNSQYTDLYLSPGKIVIFQGDTSTNAVFK